MEPSPRLVQRVRADFPEEEVGRVLAALRGLSGMPGAKIGERVQAGLVRLSAGDAGRFEQQLTLARTDWRDTLVAAGFAGPDWQRQLDAWFDEPRQG